MAVLVCIPTNSVRGFPFLHTMDLNLKPIPGFHTGAFRRFSVFENTVTFVLTSLWKNKTEESATIICICQDTIYLKKNVYVCLCTCACACVCVGASLVAQR